MKLTEKSISEPEWSIIQKKKKKKNQVESLIEATMSRPVIPPLHPPSTQIQSHQTSEVLRRRLASVEQDAQQILDQLGNIGQPRQTQITPHHSDYGQSTAGRERAAIAEKTLADRPPLPPEGSMVEPLPSSFPQDALISRVCKLESMLQTLKLGLAGATSGFTGGVDRKRQKAEVDDRVSHVKQELGSEVMRLKRQVASLQEELNMEAEARQRLKEESEKLKEALEEATQARVWTDCHLFWWVLYQLSSQFLIPLYALINFGVL